jgi:cephalosporin hydroxylase
VSDVSAQARYLELVKRAVLDELGLENELRIEYLLDVIEADATPDVDRLRDPLRYMRVRAGDFRAERQSGRFRGEDRLAPYLPLATRRDDLDALHRALDLVRAEDVPGDLVVTGAGRGGRAVFIAAYLQTWAMTDRVVWVVDRFLPPPDGFSDLNGVRDAFARYDVLTPSVRFRQDPTAFWVSDEAPPTALLCVGSPSPGAEPVDASAAVERLIAGGYVLFESEPQPRDDLRRIDSAALLYQRDTAEAGSLAPTPAADDSECDLSVIVVVYNMRRVAARTLHSLTRAYQRDLDDVDYEVIVVENGSDPEQQLGPGYVEGFGPEFRYIDMADEALPSPVGALNVGIAASRGRALAVMIDGAHVLTPGVIHHGLLGLDTYAPAIVATQQWYVGPGQQPDAVLHGYDEAAEDELFEAIDWPADGYRLFDIGHFIGDRDWLDGMWESNCLFVPRALLEESGGFDPAFSMPGGGYTNLELYERVGSSPDVTSVTILGEGSFHQVHGGTTTNAAEVDTRHGEISSYSDHFSDLRGQRYRGHGKPTHYVGAMRPNTMRSRARRQTAPHFAKAKEREGPDGLPAAPVPMPQDLQEEFIDAFWHSLAWRRASWLGAKTGKAPTDLFAYQELVTRLRPDWIVETGGGPGGRSLFLASVCEALGHGTVLSVGPPSDDRPTHPRIVAVTGVAHEPEVGEQVAARVGDGTALVVLGSRGSRQRVLREFELYAPLVPIGSYVIIEDTIVNGHPVWPGFGSGPMEAVKSIVNERAGFASDHELERYGLTFNPSGYLKRVR